MRCYIVRPFDLISRLWTYKIKINEQEFQFKGIGVQSVDIEKAPIHKVTVSTTRFYSPSATQDLDTLEEGCRIVIMSKFTNGALVAFLSVCVALIVLGGFVFNNQLLIWIPMGVSLLVHTYYFDIRRKHFFKITTEQ